ncbi:MULTISPECIES: 3-hydroxyacyl-ACP dehydratase FabZ family protein [unclassified Streptomyces]|uniref:3-hydroxyacyl-ACP dehydratase FabZ family protein n=1 Tax=unclassified Streptomyces TaxID=2593676 RepID=UPI0029AD101F|nr:3-hydroxyacyl-ACP dehydratase FabZ family protein [Streptomyces sp. DK15]MDX2393813.1 beta-hydroxyacyl-ACP dehydratase [Streptomyces sp. DK15]
MTTAPERALPRVTDLLPHRYPMLLVDRVLELVPGEYVRAVKAVTHNEPWYRGISPDSPLDYPPALLIESWGQAAGLLASALAEAPDGQVMLFGSVADAEFHLPVRPGELIEHRVRVSRALTDTVIFEGSSHRGDETVMTVARMVMAFRPAEQLRPADAPADLPTDTPDREATR